MANAPAVPFALSSIDFSLPQCRDFRLRRRPHADAARPVYGRVASARSEPRYATRFAPLPARRGSPEQCVAARADDRAARPRRGQKARNRIRHHRLDHDRAQRRRSRSACRSRRSGRAPTRRCRRSWPTSSTPTGSGSSPLRHRASRPTRSRSGRSRPCRRKAPRCRPRRSTSGCASPAPPRATCWSAPPRSAGRSMPPSAGPRRASSSTRAADGSPMASLPPRRRACRSIAAPPLKERAQFRLIGKPLARLDTPAKCNGSAIYGIDVERARTCSTPPSGRRRRSPGAWSPSGTRPTS